MAVVRRRNVSFSGGSYRPSKSRMQYSVIREEYIEYLNLVNITGSIKHSLKKIGCSFINLLDGK